MTDVEFDRIWDLHAMIKERALRLELELYAGFSERARALVAGLAAAYRLRDDRRRVLAALNSAELLGLLEAGSTAETLLTDALAMLPPPPTALADVDLTCPTEGPEGRSRKGAGGQLAKKGAGGDLYDLRGVSEATLGAWFAEAMSSLAVVAAQRAEAETMEATWTDWVDAVAAAYALTETWPESSKSIAEAKKRRAVLDRLVTGPSTTAVAMTIGSDGEARPDWSWGYELDLAIYRGREAARLAAREQEATGQEREREAAGQEREREATGQEREREATGQEREREATGQPAEVDANPRNELWITSGDGTVRWTIFETSGPLPAEGLINKMNKMNKAVPAELAHRPIEGVADTCPACGQPVAIGAVPALFTSGSSFEVRCTACPLAMGGFATPEAARDAVRRPS